MKFLKHIELNRDLIKKLKAHFAIKVYKTHSYLFYEGHIPISGYLILDGSIQISKKNKVKKIFQKGTLVGMTELLNKIPSTITVEVFPNTKICFLDKTTLLELKEDIDNDLTILLNQSTKSNA